MDIEQRLQRTRGNHRVPLYYIIIDMMCVHNVYIYVIGMYLRTYNSAVENDQF